MPRSAAPRETTRPAAGPPQGPSGGLLRSHWTTVSGREPREGCRLRTPFGFADSLFNPSCSSLQTVLRPASRGNSLRPPPRPMSGRPPSAGRQHRGVRLLAEEPLAGLALVHLVTGDLPGHNAARLATPRPDPPAASAARVASAAWSPWLGAPSHTRTHSHARTRSTRRTYSSCTPARPPRAC